MPYTQMKAPRHYYYQEDASASIYGYVPSGEPNFLRLIHGQPWWRQDITSTVLEKKALIINDPLAYFPDNRNQSIVLAGRIFALLQEGFEVYLYDNGVIAPFQIDQIGSKRLPNPIPDATADHIVMSNAIQKLKLNANKILVLNQDEMRKLVIGNDTDYSHLSDFKHIDLQNSNISGPVFSQLLEKKCKEIESINVSGCANLKDTIIPKDIELTRLHTLTIARSRSDEGTNELTPEAIRCLIAAAENLEHLDLTGCSGFYIGRDWISRVIDWSILSSLKHWDKIKTLKLDELRCDTPIILKPFSALETLDFSYSIIMTQLGELLSVASQLKTLNLKGCKFCGDAAIPFSLPNLTTLDLSSSNITWPQLERAFLNAPKLRVLNLRGCFELRKERPQQQLHLPMLETLDLVWTSLNNDQIRALIIGTRSLKALHCQFVCFFEDNALNGFHAEMLETLYVDRSVISNRCLSQLLSNTTILKKLNLYNCCNYAYHINDWDITVFNGFNASNIESLDLSCTTFTLHQILQLLRQTTRLTSLNIRNCRHLERLNFYSLVEVILPSLTLSQGEVTLNQEALAQLISIMESFKDVSSNDDPLNMNHDVVDYSLNHALKACSDLQRAEFFEKIAPARVPQDIGSVKRPEQLQKIKTNAPEDVDSADTPSTAQSGHATETLNRQSLPTTDASSANPSRKLDADTRFYPDKKLTARHIFYSATPTEPHVATYRLATFSHVVIESQPCSQTDAFTLENTEENTASLEMKKYPICHSYTDTKFYAKLATSSSANSQRFYGKYTFTLTKGRQALPSISPHERLTDYQLNSDVNVEITYSKRDNLYYICAGANAHLPQQEVTIGFMLDVPKQAQQALPKDIQEMLDTCKSFKQMDLDMTDVVHPTGFDYLRALKTQKVGACRHRALVFKEWMTKKHPKMSTRIVMNDVHAFVEIQQDDQWVTCDLGGYLTNFVVNKPLSPKVQADNAMEVCQQIVTINETRIPSVIKTIYFPSERPPEPHFETASAYAKHLITDEGLNKLIVNTDSQMLAGIRYHLQYVCQHTQRPCFYVHSPDDLICSAPYIQRNDNNTGTLKKGPSGPLHDFLIAHAEDNTTPVIIINYEQFSASDIVKRNALLDEQRCADGTPVPSKAKIIGLINPNKPDAYNGADFYSRFDKKIYEIPLTVEQLTIPACAQKGVSSGVSIEFYNDSAWETCLFGQWILHEKSLKFKESEFIKALAPEKQTIHFHFHNAPWEDESFKCFWETALLKQSIAWNGKTYPLPDGFSLTKSEGYVFSDEMRAHIKLHEANVLDGDAYVLNPGTLHRFFNEYLCDNHEQLINHKSGIIESHQGKTLSLFVSHPLTTAAWAKLLDACITHNVTLNLSLANGVNLPDECDTTMNAEPMWLTSTDATRVLHSDDVDLTLVSLCHPEQPEQIIIDISEVEPANLLKKINGALNEITYEFKFTEEDGALLHELNQGKTVILKGQFSENLIHALTEVMWKRISEKTPPGRLLIVTEHDNLFPIIPERLDSITANDKKTMLIKEFSLLKEDFSFPKALSDDAKFSELPYAKLRAMCRYSLAHPTHEPLRAWEGMESLPPIQWRVEPIDLRYTAEKTDAFNRQRREVIQNALQYSPCIFISGMTGVGKTTFIDKNWQQMYSALYIGESKLREWALDTSPGKKALFIDEATITSRGWSEFEGLFHNPQGILIDNRWFPLTSEHKVIFAGNPVSYGGERQMPSLFKRQGGSVIFEPMPMDYIYHELLRPVLECLTVDDKIIARPILEVAQYLTSLSRNHVLISPRELVTMALFTANYCQAHPDANPAEVAAYYAYTLSEAFVPEASKSDFESSFKSNEFSYQPTIETLPDFLINNSNRNAINALSEFLTLRTLRQKMHGNSVHLYGGLGGLVLEGEPGIGKTQLVVNALLAHGLTKASIAHEHAREQVFYVMPVTMPLSEKNRLLLQAFHEGAVVVIDEMNSSPMVERLLNDLLMGRSPEGEPPKQPGFMIIATQNPAGFNSNTATGRKEASHALQHRMQKITVPHYNKEEMVNILMEKDLLEDISQDMVDEYMAKREAYKAGSPLPELCFRDVLKRAEGMKKNVEKIAMRAERIAEETEKRAEEAKEKMEKSQVAGGGAVSELPEELTAARARAEAIKARQEAEAAKVRDAVGRPHAPVINHDVLAANQNLRPQDFGKVSEEDKHNLVLSSDAGVDSAPFQDRNIPILEQITTAINNHKTWEFGGLVGKSTYVADDKITPIPQGVRQILNIIKDADVSDTDKILKIREIAEAKQGWRGLSVLQLGLFTRSDDTKNFYKMIVDLIDKEYAQTSPVLRADKP